MTNFVTTGQTRDIRVLMQLLKDGYTLLLGNVYIKHLQKDNYMAWIEGSDCNVIKKKNEVKRFLKRGFLAEEVYKGLL